MTLVLQKFSDLLFQSVNTVRVCVCVFYCVCSLLTLWFSGHRHLPQSLLFLFLPLLPQPLGFRVLMRKQHASKHALACTGSQPLQTFPYALACALSAHSPSSVCLGVKYGLDFCQKSSLNLCNSEERFVTEYVMVPPKPERCVRLERTLST